jgi:hypothetical protein
MTSRRTDIARFVTLAAVLLIGTPAEAQAPKKAAVPENVIFERDIEFSNPEGRLPCWHSPGL